MNHLGRYICVEGCDGSGKTFFIDNKLVPLIRENGGEYAMIHEPCNFRTEIKHLINTITPIIENNIDNLDDIVQITHVMYSTLNLFMADRYMQHKLIEGYIQNGIYVISDRCILSSYIYQYRLIHKLIQNKLKNSFYKAPKIVEMLLDYMFDQIYEFSSNRDLMPDKILILTNIYPKISEENIDNSIKIQNIIQELYLNIHSDGFCPIPLKKNITVIHNDVRDSVLLDLLKK